ncbi:MAG: hybrid sensor histidine kinase/response regulator [Betaproteobacteria bacterium]|nr:MAG: hybrid sensor histidine kinase/response regulator [Betaproteobacteria bacterium]
MKLAELIELLATEYQAGLPAVRTAFESIASSRAVLSEDAALDNAVEFIERTRVAIEMAGLSAASKLLAHSIDVIASCDTALSRDDRSLRAAWLSQTVDAVDAYLSNGAAVESVELLYAQALSSPLEPDSEWLDAFAATLTIRPSLSGGDDDASALNIEITEANVSLDVRNADPELLSAMLADAPRQLDRLHRDLVEIELAEVRVNGRLAEAQRVAHTLKGSGNIIGIPGVANIAHRLEDVLIWLDGGEGDPAAHALALRDARVATDSLSQAVAHLNGDEAPPGYLLAVLERMQAWATAIEQDEANYFLPPPIETTSTAPVAADSADAIGELRVSDAVTLRVSSDRIGELVMRAGESLAGAQRVARTLRRIDARLSQADEQRRLLRQKLEELQRLIDRQVVVLEEKRNANEQFDPLEFDRYDSLHILSRTLSEAVQDQDDLAREAQQDLRDTLLALREDERGLREQHRTLLESRLVPFASLISRLRRSVEQTANELDKPVRLSIRGEQTTIDSSVLGQLTEPLLHILRNAVDHGIEDSAERMLRGKSAGGEIVIECQREGAQVVIRCHDDGRGIDAARVRDKAVAEGLISHDAELSRDEVIELVLQRGFSTKADVSQVSGRGIGMDVVAERMRALKGALSIRSEPGAGTEILMRVPVTAGLAQSLVVDVANERVAIASDHVITALPPGSCEIAVGPDSQIVVECEFAGVRYPVLSLAEWLGFSGRVSPDERAKNAVVLAHSDRGPIALSVDRVVDVREFVLQNVGSILSKIPGLSVGSIGDVGTPIFLIDPAALARKAESKVTLSAAIRLRQRAEAERVRILVVDDALSARRALRQSFENSGFEVVMAADGFEALEALRRHPIALIATDLEMPNLNGVELARRVREVPAWSLLPIIMITSRSGERHRVVADAAGVDRYLTKPFSDVLLIETAKSLLQQRA